GTRREGNAHGETGVGIAASADGVGQQHAVEPAVDNAVAGAQGNAAAVANKVGQGVLGVHVYGFGVGGGVAEGLHHQIRLEAQAGQVFEFVAGHGPGGVLGADGGHLGFAVGAGANAGHAAGFTHHFLRQGEALVGIRRLFRGAEQVAVPQPQGFAGAVGKAATNDQIDTAAGANFVQQYLGFEFKFRQHYAAFVIGYLL